ncbi:MAG: hypothetical protein H6838_08360 [Planctomycetes bacterium]|nr:hypothetical protein [Planctomycetota bacterium]MCB9885490.1 hypothetical protein [Planctomycetota bacterium]
MRAGLLSDARVVAILRELFVPVHVTALNTLHCMRDPRDEALLRAAIRKDTDDFDGGEREAFLLPDGTMLPVFLSLHGRDMNEWEERASHYTAEGRRAENAVVEFRHRGADALRRVHGELPEAWRQLWDLDHPAVRDVLAASPQWPAPAAGAAGLRVFSRNSYRMYDDLHGAEVVTLTAADLREWTAPLREVGARAAMPRAAFVATARAMVPRGMVDTELADGSIEGELVLVVEELGPKGVRGRVEGRFALEPKSKEEVGKRLNAACLFESRGRLRGRFELDAAGRLRVLRAAAVGVEFAWLPGYSTRDDEFEPWHRVALEWVERPL